MWEVWQVVYDPEEYKVIREQKLFEWHSHEEAKLMVLGHIKIFWHDNLPPNTEYEVRPA